MSKLLSSPTWNQYLIYRQMISTSEGEIKDVSRGGVVLVFWVRRSDPTNVTFRMNFQTMEDVEDK